MPGEELLDSQGGETFPKSQLCAVYDPGPAGNAVPGVLPEAKPWGRRWESRSHQQVGFSPSGV